MASKQVTIRSKTYASLSKAAEDLGVSISTISAAYRQGRLDKVGLSRAGAAAYQQRQSAQTPVQTTGGLDAMKAMARRECAAATARWQRA